MGVATPNQKLALIQGIYDSNTRLIQMADTKVGISIGINAIILSFSSNIAIERYSLVPKIFIMSAVISSAISSLFLIITLFPRVSFNDTKSIIFYKGIISIKKEDYIKKLGEISDIDLIKEYSKSIYLVSLIQNKKYITLQIGLVFMLLSLLLIALSFIFRIYDVRILFL